MKEQGKIAKFRHFKLRDTARVLCGPLMFLQGSPNWGEWKLRCQHTKEIEGQAWGNLYTCARPSHVLPFCHHRVCSRPTQFVDSFRFQRSIILLSNFLTTVYNVSFVLISLSTFPASYGMYGTTSVSKVSNIDCSHRAPHHLRPTVSWLVYLSSAHLFYLNLFNGSYSSE